MKGTTMITKKPRHIRGRRSTVCRAAKLILGVRCQARSILFNAESYLFMDPPPLDAGLEWLSWQEALCVIANALTELDEEILGRKKGAAV